MQASKTRDRIAVLESRVRLLLGINLVLVLGVGAAALTGFTRTHAEKLLAVDSLSVRDLVVVDSGGTVRARLSSSMPDAIIRGRRARRGQDAAGLMLYDDLGQERGGYVTFAPSRSIALTLDTRNGQVASFEADSTGGAAFGFFEGGDRLEARADTATGTGVYVWHQRSLVAQLPPLTAEQETKSCVELHDELTAAQQRHVVVTDAEIQTACEMHMSGAACKKCLGSKR